MSAAVAAVAAVATAARPRRRADVAVVEQVYRGERAFIVKDAAGGRYFRFRPAEATVLLALDGTRTPAEAAAALAAGGLPVTGGVVERFAARLAQLGLMERTLAERSTLELERLRAERRRRQSWYRGELLRMRFPLGDPDALFDRAIPHLRWCFTRGFVAASAAVFAAYLLVAGANLGEFARDAAALLAPGSLTLGALAVVGLTGAVVLAVHELAHGLACKHFGGEVHEIGVMLVFFLPAAYCNVNDAWSFPERSARLWVTAAGLWAQLLVAGAAAVAWRLAAPGTLAADVALAAMITGGLTTVAGNLNPLLPLDGYFALSDYLGIPNLRARAQEHVAWWARGRLLGAGAPEPPATARERRVFLTYGALALAYRTATLVLVAALAVGWGRRLFGNAGGAVALLGALALARGALAEGRRTAALLLRRWRTAARSRWREAGTGAGRAGRRGLVGAALAVLLLVLLAPWPLTASGAFTSAPALALPVMAPGEGVVARVAVGEGEPVQAGAVLLRLRDFGLERDEARLALAADSLAAREAAARALGAAGDAERLAAERGAAEARHEAARARVEALVVRARVDGVVLTPRPEALLGRRVAAGDPLVALGQLDSVEVRVPLDGGAGRVRAGQPVRLVSYADAARPLRAVVASVAPGPGAAGGAGARGVEARVRLAAGAGWRPGVSGRARVEFGRSTVLGALWWAARTRVRGDLLL